MLLFKFYYHTIAILTKLMYKLVYMGNVHFGHNVTFRKSFSLIIENSGKVLIGNNVFFNNFCSVCAYEKIEIGEGTIFGENVKIYDHNHNYDNPNVSIKSQGYKSAPIHIGKHCWICSNTVILKGVTIGDNCVIGAGCVIHKDIPSNSVIVNRQDVANISDTYSRTTNN